MDNSQPLDVILHLDYVPWSDGMEQEECGWQPEEVTQELREMFARLVRNTCGLALVEVEIIPQRSTPNA